MKKTYVKVQPSSFGAHKVTVDVPSLNLSVSHFFSDNILQSAHKPQDVLNTVARRLAAQIVDVFEKEIREDLLSCFELEPSTPSGWTYKTHDEFTSKYLTKWGMGQADSLSLSKALDSDVAMEVITNAVPNKKEIPLQTSVVLDKLAELIPGVNKMNIGCPKCASEEGDGLTSALPSIIMHLNDSHKTTREEIADWLDTLSFDLTIGKKEKK